jgi:transposase
MWTAAARQRYSLPRRKKGIRLADPEWALIEPHLPEHASMERPWKRTIRTILDGIVLFRTAARRRLVGAAAP